MDLKLEAEQAEYVEAARHVRLSTGREPSNSEIEAYRSVCRQRNDAEFANFLAAQAKGGSSS